MNSFCIFGADMHLRRAPPPSVSAKLRRQLAATDVASHGDTNGRRCKGSRARMWIRARPGSRRRQETRGFLARPLAGLSACPASRGWRGSTGKPHKQRFTGGARPTKNKTNETFKTFLQYNNYRHLKNLNYGHG